MEFFELIKKRRSVRKYVPDPIPESDIEKIFEAARIAPSWRNLQCWKFILVTEPKIKKQLINYTGYNKLWLGNEYGIVVACGNPEKSGNKRGLSYFLVDVAIAMEHLILAATALGIGTCWIGAFDEEKIKELLEIPDNIRIVALTPLGYPANKESIAGAIAKKVVKAKKRKPLQQVYCLNKWE